MPKPLETLPSIEITNHSAAMYFEAFGDNFTMLQNWRQQHGFDSAMSVADIGAGDADFFERAAEFGLNVTRVDEAYSEYTPKGADYITADARSMEEIPDGSFDVAVSAFLYQHLQGQPGGIAAGIREMARITRSRDQGGGLVMIYPLYGSKKFKEEVVSQFGDVAGFGYADEGGLADRGLPTTSLVIEKNDKLTSERLEKLSQAIEDSGALSRRTTVADRIRKLRMSRGKQHFNTR